MGSWGRHPESQAGAGPHDLSGVSGKATMDLGLDHWKKPAGRQQAAKAFLRGGTSLSTPSWLEEDLGNHTEQVSPALDLEELGTETSAPAEHAAGASGEPGAATTSSACEICLFPRVRRPFTAFRPKAKPCYVTE